MSNFRWQHADGHPPVEVLLLHIEHELSAAEEAAVKAHMPCCWTCAMNCERLRQGMFAFVHYVETAPLPEPPDVTPPFDQRLYAVHESARGGAGSWRNLLPARLARKAASHRPAWITAGLAAVSVALLLLVPEVTVSRLTAAEVVKRMRGASRDGGVETFVVRRSGQERQRTIIRSLHRAGDVSHGFPLDDPLHPERLAEWWESLAFHSDSVRESGDLVILTTRTTVDPDVRAVALSVRRADWRPVAASIELRDAGSMEVLEVSNPIAAAPTASAEIARAATRHRTAAVPPDPAPTAPAGKAPAPAYTSPQLEQMEADARLVLYSLGVGLNGQEGKVVIAQTQQGLSVDAVTGAAERRDELQQALARIPGVIPNIRASGDVADAVSPVSPSSVVLLPQHDPQESLTRPMLVEYFGSAIKADQFENRALELSRRLKARGAQLQQLAARYPGSQFAELPPSAQAPIRMVLVDLVRSMKAELYDLAVQTGPFFDAEYAPASGLTLQQRSETCLPWQEQASAIQQTLLENDRLLGHLFAVGVGARSSSETAAEAVASVRALESRAATSLAILCP